jgi:hypothetical protein
MRVSNHLSASDHKSKLLKNAGDFMILLLLLKTASALFINSLGV